MERRRKRMLNDDEIRLLWIASEDIGTYGALARFALLTGQRLRTIANAKWADIDVGGTWSIPQGERQKGNGGVLPLSNLAIDIIRRQGRVNDYIFAGRKAAFNGFGRGKARLDAAITEINDGEPIPAWVFHDLRRSARSLLARAGVQQEIAERVLGHTQDAIVEVYDLHDYERERGVALQKLAAQVEMILNPPADNVREFAESAQ